MAMEGFFKLQTPEDLLRKLEREYAQLQQDPQDVDLAYNFFLTAENLPEWIKSGGQKGKVFNHTTPQQRLIRTLLNELTTGAKHFILGKEKPTVASVTREDWVPPGWVPPGWAPPGWVSAPQLMVHLSPDQAEQQGQETIAVQELARQVLAFWQRQLQTPFDPEVLLPAAIILTGDKTQEGILVQGVAIAWEEIIRELAQDPEFLFKIGWRKLEEIIAGAYQREGWSEVILTPRSGDGGRDIIATKNGIGSIRFYDQVKAYKLGHLVTANEVRAMYGVLTLHQNVSKAVVTTTSRFAPGVDDEFKPVMPHRLELKNREQLLEWLEQIRRSRSSREG